MDYESDHSAIQIIVSNQGNDHLLGYFKELPTPQFNYKNTNWKKFKNCVLNELNSVQTTPNDRNLSNQEIDFYLLQLNSSLINSIEKSVPKFKSYEPIAQFLNPTIKKLQREKSKILTKIKKT